MTELNEQQIADLLLPYVEGLSHPIPSGLVRSLHRYLDLLSVWGGRMNLSAIRSPAEVVRRHFGESLFLADMVPDSAVTLLDLGSGAGFPGLPVQLLRPDLKVTLAESQGKKSAFLREVVRALELPTQVHQGRAELLDRTFDVVSLRAVDQMRAAVDLAGRLGKQLLVLTSRAELGSLSIEVQEQRALPDSQGRVCALGVPRGTTPGV